MSPCPYQWIDQQEQLELLGVGDGTMEMAVDLEADSLYRFEERICLVQVSTAGGNFVIDALTIKNWDPLCAAMEDPRIRKVFHGADYDIRLIKKSWNVSNPRNLFDTMIAAQVLGMPKVGLSDLLQEQMGVKLEKRYQKADWGRRPLSPEMIEYAVRDTCYLLELSHVLELRLRESGRLEWALEEFEALSHVQPVERGRPQAWDVKGARSLTDQQRAVLQELLKWRHEEAKRRDVPPFKVLRTEILRELAIRCPSTREELLQIKGLSRKDVERVGPSILEAVERARRAAPPCKPSRPPGPPRRPGSRKRFVALKEIRDDKARELGLHPGFLCPNHVLRILSGLRPEHLEEQVGRWLKGWRARILMGPFMRVLRGEVETHP